MQMTHHELDHPKDHDGSTLPESVAGDRRTAADHALMVLRTHFEAFWQMEPPVRRGQDGGAVHDMRVAARRMRAALRIFHEHLPPESQPLRGEIRDVARALGALRDLDLMIEQVREWSRRRLNGDPDAARSVLALLARHRAKALVEVVAHLDSDRYRSLIADMTSILDTPAAATGTGLTIGEMAPDLIRSQAKEVRKAAARASRSGAPGDYHGLRIRCKRLRYSIEFLGDLYGPPGQKMIRSLVRVQDCLGEYQDAQAGIAQMRKLVEEGGSSLLPRTTLMLGEIIQCYRGAARRRLASLPKRLRRIGGSRWKALRKAMRDSVPSGETETTHGHAGTDAMDSDRTPDAAAPTDPVQNP
jgi:CHAD domain-containing protein